jgi:hypothetical protein
VTLKVTVGLPVNVFESLAVRTTRYRPRRGHGRERERAVPVDVAPACRFAWIDQSAAFAVSFTESVVMRLAGISPAVVELLQVATSW